MQKKLILLVEDNQDDELLTIRALKKNSDYKVTVLRDGVEALDYFFGAESENSEMPHIILLDLKLPKVNGLAVLRKLRSEGKTKRLPVVVLTSSKEERDILESYDLGVNSYIRKPVDFVAFSDAVQQLGLYWLLLNEPPPKVG
jgi:CheY-like chemotaxis protein